MALRDLLNDTTLKSIRYGNDQLNEGSSGQPYITTDVGDPNLTNLTLARGELGSILRSAGISPTITINNKIGKDAGFIRGGFLGAANASIVDTFRVGSWIVNNPLWIAKQIGLQLSNPRLEIPKNASLLTNPGNILSLGTNGIIQPTRIYNLGINTALQVPVNAFGVHFYRHGLGPVMDDNQKYEAIARANNDFLGLPNNNRLVSLKNKLKIGSLVVGSFPPVLTGLLGAASRILPDSVNSILNTIFGDNTPIDDYLTGPNSVYGIGSTTIRRYQNTSIGAKGGELNNLFLSKGEDVWNNNTAITDINYGFGKNIPLVSNFFGLSKDIIDASNQTGIDSNGNLVVPVPELPDYTNITLANNGSTAVDYGKASPSLRKYGDLFAAIKTNIEQSIPFSDAERYNPTTAINSPFTADRRYFKTQDLTAKAGLDRGAADFRYYGKRKTSDEGSVSTYGEGAKVFERYDSDILTVIFRGVDPFTLNEERWAFSAYLSNFRDEFGATWNDVNYIGRSETFYIYSKFRRSVSFSLKIPCFNRTQLFEKHRALGQLASTTAGRYNPNGTNTLGGMLLRLNVGNYLVGEYATMNSLQYNIPDDSSWDITPEARLAMYIEASFSFNIVHQKLPQYLPSRAAGGDNNDAGFFGYLPNTVAGDAEFLGIENRTRAEQNDITTGFSINLVDNPAGGSKGTVLAKENPKPVVGNSSRYSTQTTT
jgi:hypothetical protein